MTFWQNELAPSLWLDGEWEFSLNGKRGLITVPGCWEAQGYERRMDGPAEYRKAVRAPREWRGQRIELQFDAVSYYVEINVNGVQVGTHTGLWSPFALDVTEAIRPGADNEIRLTVYKPGERFPVRESLAGFLPDVFLIFGGIWQSARLVAFPGREAIGSLEVSTRINGEVRVSASQVGIVRILDPGGVEVAHGRGAASPEKTVLKVDNPILWQPDHLALYTVEVSLENDRGTLARTRRKIGFRELTNEGDQLLFNGQPVMLRGALNWGWYPEILCPAPDEATIRDEFRRVRELGFNMVKMCLYVPSPLYLDIADEDGMLLWLELPMWLPEVTPRLRQQAPLDYADILTAVHHHPSIVIYSLGCELNQTVSADFMAELNTIVRRQVSGALVCDNSGSGEAYGGEFDFADFNDYHFYCDLHYFEPLVDHFSRDWRNPRPWIFGEFCDADDFRNLDEIESANGGALPWYLNEWNPLHPKTFVAYADQKNRMAQAGLDGKKLQEISRRQSLVIRKAILEKVRARAGMGGYVVTGLRDTPLSTSAVYDDLGRSKYDSEAFKMFNADTVLLIGRGRARTWTRGGDRPSPFDPYSFIAGERINLEVILSHTGGIHPDGGLFWRVMTGDEQLAGDTQFMPPIPAGRPQVIAHVAFDAPPSAEAYALQLEVALDSGEHNAWTLWIFPAVTAWPEGIGLYDPVGALTGLDDLWEASRKRSVSDCNMLIASGLNTDVRAFLRGGGSVLLLQQGNRPLLAVACPFWREGIKLIGDHPALNAFPHQGFTDLQFYGLGTDWALDSGKLASTLPGAEIKSLPLRRLDARQFYFLDYMVEAQSGAGRLLASTLRFQGGAGDQPMSLRFQVAGRWLLYQLLKSLEAGF